MHVIVVNENDLDLNSPLHNVNNNHLANQGGHSTSPIETMAKFSNSQSFSLDKNGKGRIRTNREDSVISVTVPKRRSLPEMIPAFGILMSILSVFSFSIASLIVKVLTQLHSLEILFIRCSFQFICYIIPVIYYKHPIFGVSGHRIDLAIRACFGTSAAICIYMAYRLIPLADATTIQFSAPVLALVGAFFILKERLTLITIFTGVVTLFGVIIIAKPEFIFGSLSEAVEGRTEGIIFAVVAACSTATVMVILRRLKTTPVPVVCVWFSCVSMVVSLSILLATGRWVWPEGWFSYSLLVAIGILGTVDQFFMTIALHYEGAGPVALTRTLNIVLSFVWDVLILSESYDWTSIVGAVLVSACITLLAGSKWREEKPEQFERTMRKCCCCCYKSNEEDDNECDVLIVRKQSENQFYDSIDDKGFRNLLNTEAQKPMERNNSFNVRNDEIVVEKNS